MKKYIFLVLLSIIIQTSCLNRGGKDIQEISESIQFVLDSLLKSQEIPGINFSFIWKDANVNSFSAGYADFENKVRMDSSRVMFSGSIGKTYAAALIMHYVDEGIIDLEDKIIGFFPQEDWLQNLPNSQDISIGMLLSHSSGLPRYVMQPEIWDTLQNNPDKVWSYRDRLEVIFNKIPVHEAGKGWYYSDTNYILLGMLIEKLSGKEYYEVLGDRILKPYGLENTYASITRSLPNLPIGYSRLPEMFHMPEKVVVDGNYIFNPQLEWTGGGLASTTADLAMWTKIYYSGELFSDSILSMILTPSVNGTNIAPGTSYGMGSFIFETRHGEAYGHTGFVPGFNSVFAFFPEKNLYMALQTNCDYAEIKEPLIEYLCILIDKMIKDRKK